MPIYVYKVLASNGTWVEVPQAVYDAVPEDYRTKQQIGWDQATAD